MCILNWLKDWGLLISWPLLVITAATLWVVIRIPNRVYLNQVFSDLLDEYRTTKMGIAIKSMWDFYTNQCGGDSIKDDFEVINSKKELIVKKYKGILDKDNKRLEFEEEWRDSLHYNRRLVSQFYRHLAMFRFGRPPKLKERKIKSFFTSGDIRVLGIIVPIEESFVKKEDKVPESLIFLTKLYYKSQSKSWKDLGDCLEQYNKKKDRWKKKIKLKKEAT